MPLIRLQKYLSQCGIASRREAEELMGLGLISVNGRKILKPGLKVNPDTDRVSVRNKVIYPEKKVYVLLNKPKGYITTVKDPHAKRTVLDLLRGINKKVFPVGRLDKDTRGLLLLTNDGDICFKLTHPRHKIEKTYSLKIKGYISDRDSHRIQKGILIDGRKTLPAKVVIKSRNKEVSEINVKISEGRNRQIRKMMKALGYELLDLQRIEFGPFRLKGLREGQFRLITRKEVSDLLIQPVIKR